MLSRSVSDRPSRSTDHEATISNSLALTAFIMASRPGRMSRPFTSHRPDATAQVPPRYDEHSRLKVGVQSGGLSHFLPSIDEL
jgi:hypothetical protein